MSKEPPGYKLLTVKFQSEIRGVSICVIYTDGNFRYRGEGCFQWSKIVIQERLTKAETVILIVDLNSRMGFDNSLPRHITEEDDFRKHNNNDERFLVFCNFHLVIIGGTLLKHKACYKIIMISTHRQQTESVFWNKFRAPRRAPWRWLCYPYYTKSCGK